MPRKIVFIIGENGTGKTSLGNNLNLHGYAIARSITTKPLRDKEESRWYEVLETKDFIERDLLEHEEHGGHIYGTELKAIINSNTHIVKVIEPRGMMRLKNFLAKHHPYTQVAIIYMDIDKDVIVENLKKDGYSELEILKRIARGTITQDIIDMGIEEDVHVTVLNENTHTHVLHSLEKHWEMLTHIQTKQKLIDKPVSSMVKDFTAKSHPTKEDMHPYLQGYIGFCEKFGEANAEKYLKISKSEREQIRQKLEEVFTATLQGDTEDLLPRKNSRQKIMMQKCILQ